MKYFKNIQLAELYKVSDDTIAKWIKSARNGRVNLQLYTVGDRSYILDSETNHALLKILADKARKYKNRKSLKIITPQSRFYDLFNKKQIIDIITNIEVNREIPLKYSYCDIGAGYWDEHINRLLKDKVANTTTNSVELLKLHLDIILARIQDFDLVNIIDIGVGNAAPIKEFIQALIKKDKLRKYIGIDISRSALEIVEKNMHTWFGDKFPFKGYVKDMDAPEGLKEILFENAQLTDNKTCLNIILCLGSTLPNQRVYTQFLNVLRENMGQNDIFILGQRLDTDKSRTKLNFTVAQNGLMVQPVKISDLKIHDLVVELLNIKEEYYEVERTYSEKDKVRTIRIIPHVDLQINFQIDGVTKSVYIPSKEKVLLWRHRQYSYSEVILQVENAGYEILNASRSLDNEQIFVMAKLRSAVS